ncbi:hypothetical protein [Cardiobacterium valvarum]|uniref:hypothetical protein n=1 Tax=Cardiobacterium valvarum TaxID=194702 RepID=UPI0035E8F46C
MQKIRVGIIGLSANGGWGAMSHYPALRALPEYFTLNGLAAGSPASAAAAAAKYGVPYHTASAAALAARDDTLTCSSSPSTCRSTVPCWKASSPAAKPSTANGHSVPILRNPRR